MLHTSAETASLIERALAEDQASADITTQALISPTIEGSAVLIARASGVLAGIQVALAVFQREDPTLSCQTLMEDAATVAAGIRVPAAVGDFLILRAVRESGGFAVAVSDESIIEARDRVASDSGFLMCPEGAATLAAYLQETKNGRIGMDESAVLFNCATGLKYPMPEVAGRIDCNKPLDAALLRAGSLSS